MKKLNYIEMVLNSEDDPFGISGIELRECPECGSNQVEEDEEGNPKDCFTCGWKSENGK